MSRRPDPELRWLARLAVVLFSGTLALGLAFYFVNPAGRAAHVLLQIGLLTLIATPGVRVLVEIEDQIRTRNRTFLILMMVVVGELAIVLWRAATAP